MNSVIALACILTGAEENIPLPPREFRGVWVATVANIDWPSKPGLPVDVQKRELISILDRCVELGLNAVVFQVRTMGDALYESKLEPWSEFITGTMGKRPEPFYDPLTFAIEESHKRGLELHAWFNPYRAGHPATKTEFPKNHMMSKRTDLAKKYGRYGWLDPGEPEVQQHSLDVILDVVNRYDVDGVHLDDYFYPYKEKNEKGEDLDFPDEPSWKKYQAAGGKLLRDDWRRDNINQFVKRMYDRVKEAKPSVLVGISPFGIWRPGYPEGIQGFDQYAGLYADAKLWFNKGWVDYFTPQLYWPIEQKPQSFPKLLSWWASENTMNRHLWPGHIPSRVSRRGWSPKEIADQIEIGRKTPKVSGDIHFSMKALMSTKNGLEGVFKEVYAKPALTPASTWIPSKKPVKPSLQIANGKLTGEVPPPSATIVSLVAVENDSWSTTIVPTAKLNDWKTPSTAKRLAVAHVNRVGQIGDWQILDAKP